MSKADNKELEEAIKTMQHWIEYEKENREKIYKADELIKIQETVLKELKRLQEENKDLKEKNKIEFYNKPMKSNKMSEIEAIDIVDKMYQDKTRQIEENNTIYVDRIEKIKFTILEFASVILLREVLSLEKKLKNSIEKDKIRKFIEKAKSDITIKGLEIIYVEDLEKLLEDNI